MNVERIVSKSIVKKGAAIVAAALVAAGAWACTSALVGADASATGRWMLWKHRDSVHNSWGDFYYNEDTDLEYIENSNDWD